MTDFTIMEIIEELKLDNSWCKDSGERETLIGALINLLITS
ncbi:MAG: hypothetical protein ACOWWR_08505 [Eubacteriales bacterium]